MKVFLIHDGARAPLRVVNESWAESDAACPACARTPLRVRGDGKRMSDDDRAYEANAVCYDCGVFVGVIRAEVDTMFGVREDQAIGLRARVYV